MSRKPGHTSSGKRNRAIAVVLGRAADGVRPVERAEIRPHASHWGAIGLPLAHVLTEEGHVLRSVTRLGERFAFTERTAFVKINADGKTLPLTREQWRREALIVFDSQREHRERLARIRGDDPEAA